MSTTRRTFLGTLTAAAAYAILARQTLAANPTLEYGFEAISSTPHGLWHGVKLLGVPARVQGFGMVMAKG